VPWVTLCYSVLRTTDEMINSKGWLWLRRQGDGVQDQFVTTNVDTLATALYVRTDDWPMNRRGSRHRGLRLALPRG
jgi:hypothetical protein